MALVLITKKIFRDRIDELINRGVHIVSFRMDPTSWGKHFWQDQDATICDATLHGMDLVLFDDIPGEINPNFKEGTLVVFSRRKIESL